MFRAARLAALLIVCATTLAFAAPVERRVYKVDSVIATVKGRTLTIQAKGAVESGGWRKARLHVLRSLPAQPHTILVEFVAQPPPPGMTVIQALVPIAATIHIRSRRHVVSVRALADANEVTSQVLH